MFRQLVVAAAAVVSVSAVALSAPGASAQDDRARARAEFDRGVQAYAVGDYPTALAAFQEAYRLQPHPTVRVNLANCYDHLDRPIEAIFHFEHYLQEAGRSAPREQKREVEAALARLRQRVGEVVLRVAPDGALVTIDGGETRRAPIMEPVGLVAGSHRIETRLEGFRTDQRTVEVTGGARAEVQIRLERPAATVASAGAPPPAGGAAGAGASAASTAGAAAAAISPVGTPTVGATAMAPASASLASGGATQTATVVGPSGAGAGEPGGAPQRGSAQASAGDAAGDGAAGDDGARGEPAIVPPASGDGEGRGAARGLRITTPTVIAAAATGALLIAAIATGVAATGASAEFDDLASIASDPLLPVETRARAADDARAAADRANALATVTDVLGVAALVGVGATATLFFLAQREESAPAGSARARRGRLAAAPMVAPGGVGVAVAGTF
jgi:hypothetical protein